MLDLLSVVGTNHKKFDGRAELDLDGRPRQRSSRYRCCNRVYFGLHTAGSLRFFVTTRYSARTVAISPCGTVKDTWKRVAEIMVSEYRVTEKEVLERCPDPEQLKAHLEETLDPEKYAQFKDRIDQLK